MGFFSKIINGLKKTKDAIASKLSGIFSGHFDDDFYEELEFVLISSDMGVAASNEIVECVMEIAMSNTGSAITSIIVFIPVFFLEGILGEVFFDMAVSIVCAITTSCLLSLSYIPALYSILPDKSLHQIQSDKIISKIEMFYDKILKKLLEKKSLVFIPIILTILLGFIFLFLLPMGKRN